MVGPRALFSTVILACALAGAALIPAAAYAAPAQSSASADADEADEAFQEEDCPVDVPAEYEDRVTCGTLTVPERRTPEADPSKTLVLPVVVIESRADDADDPLVFPTSGGPGGGAVNSLWYFLDYADWALDDRDVILVEQRGDGLAEPSLNCPELDLENFVEDGVLLSGEADRARRSEQIVACRDRLTAEGIDLAAYTSAESAVDLADLRTALGYDEWNLYGLSYGARLALTVMRDRPDGLQAVILDGVYPPQINRYEDTPAGFLAAVDTMLAACADDADCGKEYPDLEKSLLDLLARAADTPLTVTVDNPVDGTPLTLHLSDADLTVGLFNAFYDAETIRALPYVIDRLAKGEAETAVPLAQRNVDNINYFSEGLSLSIDCSEEAPFNDDERIAAALTQDPLLAHYPLSEGFREDCELWGVPALSGNENSLVTSAIPALLMTGQYDPVTPEAFAASTAEGLSVAHRYSFPGQGHAPVWTVWSDDCAAGIAQQFLLDPVTPPDASCIEAMPATDFLIGEDIHATSSIYRLDGELLRDRNPVQIAIAALTILVFIATLVYAAAYGLTWLSRRRGDAPGGLVLVAATSSGLNLAYVCGMVAILFNTDPILLAFGLPSGAWPLLLVPFIALSAGILLIVSLIRAWMQEEGSLFHRVVLSVSALASALFALWLLARGLLML